ncbi:MAG: hypothetical protein HYU51_00375 [Candidatus Rokubacteria bacterium]|nr:hypothetical protein [Candidatus Rokubacteria bacterium]
MDESTAASERIERNAGDSWWGDLDRDVLACLDEGARSPQELGQRLGVSESALTSVLLMLAAEGRVRISRVEIAR